MGFSRQEYWSWGAIAFSEPEGSSLSILPPQDAPEKLAGVGGNLWKVVEGREGAFSFI